MEQPGAGGLNDRVGRHLAHADRRRLAAARVPGLAMPSGVAGLSRVDTSGSLFCHGAHAGLELAWYASQERFRTAAKTRLSRPTKRTKRNALPCP
jgi:hypothetical protein